MKKIFLLTLMFLLSNLIFSQSKILESISMDSKLLGTSIKYSIYLPDGYEKSSKTYPVVYLLNGFTGDETNWVRYGMLRDIADELIRGKKIKEMIIVMPDGDDRLYSNKGDGSYPYEDMFIKEFIPFIENEYRIKNERNFRGISGLSMGGSGSLKLSLKYPDIFGSCAAFSSGILTREEVLSSPQNSYDDYFGRISPSSIGKKGDERFTAAYNDYDILYWVRNKNPEELKKVNIYFDCGDDDFLTVGNSMLHIEMTKKNIPHEFRMRDGAHTWNFWQDSLPIGLEFISDHM